MVVIVCEMCGREQGVNIFDTTPSCKECGETEFCAPGDLSH